MLTTSVETKICKYCKAKYHEYIDRPSDYCCDDCLMASQRTTEINNKIYPVTCIGCGKQIMATDKYRKLCPDCLWEKHLKKMEAKKLFSLKRLDKPNICICGVCNKEFRAAKKGSLYCSPKCRLSSRGITGYEWSSLREMVLERDNFKCRDCGNNKVLFLEVHHVVPLYQSGTNKRENLVTLCESCHVKRHQIIIKESGIRSRRKAKHNPNITESPTDGH